MHDRLAVTDPEYLGLTKIRELLDGPKILIVIEREPWPARCELGPRGDYVAGEERAPIGPPERQASGRVPRRWDHLERADAIARFQRAIHLAGRVPAEPERQPQLKLVNFQRFARDQAHPSRLASASDYVHFPSMRAHGGGARFLQRSEAAKVRLVSMREDDVLQVRGPPTYSRNLGKHHLAVVVIQRINERQAVAVVEEVGMNVSAFLLRHAVNAWTNLHVRFLVGGMLPDQCRCPGLLRLRAGSLRRTRGLDFLPGMECILYVSRLSYYSQRNSSTVIVLQDQRLPTRILRPHKLISFLWESSEYIPDDVWFEYVIPQMALQRTVCPSSYTVWTKDSSVYLTEGIVWRGHSSREEFTKRIGNTKHTIIPQE